MMLATICTELHGLAINAQHTATEMERLNDQPARTRWVNIYNALQLAIHEAETARAEFTREAYCSAYALLKTNAF